MPRHIFRPTGVMNQPGLSCQVCKYPKDFSELFLQDGRLVCGRHLRPLPYTRLVTVSNREDEYWDFGDSVTFGGRTGRV